MRFSLPSLAAGAAFFAAAGAALSPRSPLPVPRSLADVAVISSSHQDTAWMDTPAFCREFRINKNILPALDMMRANPDYCFAMECGLHLMEFIEKHPERRDEIHKRMLEGRFEFGATYNQPYESYLSGEELVRQTYFGRRWIRKNFPGADAIVAFNPDVPARALQMQQILAKAGAPYLFTSRYHEGVHRWLSPDGSGVIAYTPGHYDNDKHLLNARPVAKAVAAVAKKAEWRAADAARDLRAPVLPFINSADFSRPTNFDALIAAWNATAGDANGPAARFGKMRYASMRQFFDAAVKPAAGSAAGGAPRFNVVRGERPDTWLYIHGPTHERTTTLRREAARLLPAAEAFNAFAAGALDDGSFRNYPTADLNRAWLDELYIDHGIGGKNGHITDEVFHQKVVAARDTAAGTLGNALRRIAGAVETRPTLGEPVVVFNTLSWARSAPVEVELNDHRPLTTPFTVTDAAGEIVPAQLSFVDAPTERNVALATAGATATASSQFSADYAPAKAIDGRWSVQNPHPEVGESHKWNSAATAGTAAAGTAPHWLALDLGRERVISKIVLRHEGTVGSFNGEPRTATHSAFNTRDFRLQYADAAGGPWRDLCAPVTGNTAAHTAHRFPPTRARHLRVLIEKPNSLPNDDAARLYEFEAYERDADIAAAENLARLPGVKATASSRFNAQYDAGAVVDGKWSVRDPRSRRERSHKWNSAPSTGTDTGGTPAGNKANGGLAGPHWLALDLGARRAVARVVLRHEGANEGGDGHSANTRDFRIQCADAAGGPWRDLAVVTGNTAAVSEHRFPAVETRHLRVLITRPSQHGDRYARLYEFEAYAPAPPATPRRAKLVFVAKDVPAFGYRTYYVQKAGSSQAGGVHATTRSPLPAPLSLLPTFENAFYRLTLAPGGIASLYEKQQRRELLATGDGPRELRAAEPFTLLSVPPNKRGAGTDAGEFGCTPKPVLDGTYARVAPDQGFPFFARHRLLETGPVREVWGYAVPWVNGTTAVQRITLWRDLPQIDIAIELRDFDGEFWREFRLAFPLALRDPKITYEVPFGTVTVGEDEIRGTGGHAYGRLNYSEPCAAVRPRENQNFIDASDAAGGLTLTATTAVFDWLSPFDPAFAKDAPPPPAGSERTAAGGAAGAADAGGGAAGSAAKSAFPVTLQPVLLASRKSCNGAGNWYPQTGTHTYRFALTPHTGDWRNSWRAATAANHPLVPVLAAATTGATAATAATSLPEVHSFLTLRDAAGAVVSAVKKAEDADALAIRLVEMTGTPARPTLVFPRPHTLTPTNILEYPATGSATDTDSGTGTAGNVVPLTPHSIETVLAK